MVDEEYEIDIYGDTTADQGDTTNPSAVQGYGGTNGAPTSLGRPVNDNTDSTASEVPSNDPRRPNQGVKRRSQIDLRTIDPGATSAVLISDLNWWNTDDDIRGWAEQAQCGHELNDVTFSEYKVNGKSKGQAYVEFSSPQAACMTKRVIDSVESDQPGGQKRHSVIYSNPASNPYKTIPKEGPMKGKEGQVTVRPMAGPYVNNDRPHSMQPTGFVNNFRGGRGGGGPGGGYGAPRGGNQGTFNRNFNPNFNNQMGPGLNQMGGGFNNHMPNSNFAFNRGGNMAMRGAQMRRGGMPQMNMMGMPMGMGMAIMGQGIGMGNPAMNAGMGMPAFPMQTQFNPFFQANANEWQNPHGAKRARSD